MTVAVDDEAVEELTEEESAEVVAAGLEALEDAKHGRLLTLEEADVRFEADFAAARERVCDRPGESGLQSVG